MPHFSHSWPIPFQRKHLQFPEEWQNTPSTLAEFFKRRKAE
jgi:hypothetical protein